MGRGFNPYYKWLGIPPNEQPANFYRLLGIQTFEADPDVIQAAADQRMAHLRNYQTGQHADLSQRLLNEVAAARVGLLNPAKKAAYDKQLRAKVQAIQTAADEANQAAADEANQAAVEEGYAVAPSDGLLAGMLDELDYPTAPVRTRRFFGRSRSRVSLAKIITGVAVVGALWLLIDNWQWSANPPTTPEPTVQPQQRVIVESAKKTKQSDDAAKRPKASDATAEVKNPVEALPWADALQKSADKPAPSPKKSAQAHLSLTPDTNPSSSDPTTVASPDRGSPAELNSGLPDGFASKRQPPRERVAVPGAVDQEQAMKLARDLYKDDLAKAKTAEDKLALARRLFEQAVSAPSADAGTFVLLQLARDTAVQAVDGAAAFTAVDAMAERYQIDAPAMKAEILATFAKKARTLPQHVLLAEQAARLMDEAAAAGSFPAAADLGKLAISEGGQAHNKELVARVKACLPDFQNAAKLVAEFEAAKAKLTEAPEDPEANLTAGRFYCFIKGDWKTGLPHLAKASDLGLRVLAGKELAAAPAQADDQLVLADGWWDVGQSEEGVAKLAVLRHAKSWYSKADLLVTEALNKAKIGKRLDEIAKFEGEKSLAATSRSAVRFGQWFPLLGSPNELTGWEVADCRHSYFNWIIEVQEDCLVCPIVAKDMAVRCFVNRNSGAACLTMRNCDAGYYALVLEDRRLKILYQKYSVEPEKNVRFRRAPEVLNEFLLPRSSTNVRLFLGFSVEGTTLTAFVDGQPVMHATDSALTEGTVGVGAIGNSKVYFSDIDLFIPSRASLVTDQRNSFGLSNGAAGEFKLPSGKSSR